MRQISSAPAPAIPRSAPRIVHRLTTVLWCMVVQLFSAPTLADEPLTLHDAVTLATTQSDPALLGHAERAGALQHRAIGAAQLPDPELQFGFANWPVESFDYDQEPMTQIRAGIRQRFPRGRSLALLGERKATESLVETARGTLTLADNALATKQAWYELYYLRFADETVRQSHEAVSELVDVVQASFATGLQSNQDLLRAELELSLLDDRALDIARQTRQYRADLARYIGKQALRPIATTAPDLPPLSALDDMDDALVRHPTVAIQDELIAARDLDVQIAREQYKPGFAIDAGYGARGGNRADFASVMVSVQVPLFPDKRQNQVLAASEKERAAAQLERDALLLDLRRQALRARADIERLTKRVELYHRVVIERANGVATAALDGYQNQVSDFAELIRARLSALETTLKLRRLEADLGRAYATFDYLMAGA